MQPNDQNSTIRKIIHIDMDCFYAAVEVRERPELAGLPVAVGGSTAQHGVLCTCNYIARKYGLHSAMATATALKLCPDLVLLPVNMALYKEVSQKIQAIFRKYTPLVEPLAFDEAYLDVSQSDWYDGSATLIAESIRRDIWEEECLTASAGVSVNKFLAKIASGWNKPNGIFVIGPDQVMGFVEDLAVNKLFGVGKVTAAKLERLGVRTCRELKTYSLPGLNQHFGKLGTALYFQSRGIDNRKIESNRPRKSLSIESTFNPYLQTNEEIDQALNKLYDGLVKRLNNAKISSEIKSQFIKIKFSDFKLITAESATTVADLALFKQLLAKCLRREQKPTRLLGLGVDFNLAEDLSAFQPGLF